ncbi:uncharacterized protein BO66DRAFT_470494 [Aspergillus aculeatinus CBS 121060]|uniref:Uncharacterized protein n=1 Tax=Aspergillus aculeatinus CBS 121060 TaxID=1448322 RepID=A0ACD1HD49_9EURO|nr:hypothetical protein BO66DRAFT_470494 [Aspergillus aculeatinus CBS 121060]RAH71321.1 hypothetical protein BO66DRAFT_470494 [Aspergillus aculeatinus CBS 121060]
MAQPEHFDYLWDQAKARYKSITGHDLDSPAFPNPASADDLLLLLDARNTDFLSFREKRSMLFHNLSTLCQPIESLTYVISTGTSVVFPPSAACFAALTLLIDAARGVSSLYDSIIGLIETLKDFLARIKIYAVNQATPELRSTLVTILVILLEVFGRSAKIIRGGTLGRTLAFAKNTVLGRDEKLQGLLNQLEKLCQSENRLVAAETWAETKRTAHQMDQVSDDLGTLVLGQETFRDEFREEMHKVRETVTASSARQEKSPTAIREILKPSVHPADAYQSLAKKRVAGTADWIIAEPLFEQWVADEGQTPLGASIAYFFFSNSDTETKSFSQALRDCAHQVYQNNAAYQAYLEAHLSSPDDIKTIRSTWRLLYTQHYIAQRRTTGRVVLVLNGLDEAFQADREQFFELLSDLPSGSASQIKILLVGRPEIYAELIEQINTIPCIQVDAAKNSADIRALIETTMRRTRVLSRIPRDLSAKIQDELIEKSQGMFLWADLMLRELSRKTRTSSMLDSLQRAPRGLDEMLEHVLRGFSAKLDAEEAENLNTMLAWLACSDVPLSLRQLDYILQYDSPGGDGVFDLETMLRVQYASFFLLLRDDGLTTADLQGAEVAAYLAEGRTSDDLLEFQSNKETTRVVFRHASISEYLRNPAYGKVRDSPGSVPVGVNIIQARTHILIRCLKLFQDGFAEDEDKDGRVSLIIYAQSQWLSYLRHLVSNDRLDPHSKREIRSLFRRLLSAPDCVHWLDPDDWEFFSSGDYRLVESLLNDTSCSADEEDDEITEWLSSCRQKPGGVFSVMAEYAAEGWLKESAWSASECFRLVWAVKIISEDGDVKIMRETPSTETVLEVARWTKLEEDALWHERVGNCLSNLGHLDDAKHYAEMSLSLQPKSVAASLDIARIYLKQHKRSEAIDIYLETEKLYTKSLLEQQEPDHEDSDLDMLVSPYSLSRLRLTLSELYLEQSDCLEAATWLHSCLQLGSYSIQIPKLAEALVYQLSMPPYRNYGEIMRLLRSMDREPEHHTETFLDDCLIQYRRADSRFLEACATAAHAMGALEWLADRYRHARAAALQDLRSTVVVCLDVCLAQLYSRFMNEPHKAKAKWRQILSLPRVDMDDHWEMTQSRSVTESSYAYQLYMDALKDPKDTGAFLHEVAILARWLREVPLTRDISIANQAGLYLGRWHLDHGDAEQARLYFRGYIKISLAHLEDIDPAWRADAFYKLFTILVAADDDANAISLFHAIRDAPQDSRESTLPDDWLLPWAWCCDVCKQEYDSSAPCNKCRVCAADLCPGCFASVQQATASARVCAPDHAWLSIHSPSVLPEQGFVIVKGSPMSIDHFLADLGQFWE